MEEGDVPFMGVYMGMSKETNYIVFVTIMGKEMIMEENQLRKVRY